MPPNNPIWGLPKLRYFSEELSTPWNRTVNCPSVSVVQKLGSSLRDSNEWFRMSFPTGDGDPETMLARDWIDTSPSIIEGYVSLFLLYRFLGYSLLESH